ncbi:hypothetical protein [Eubacterium sp.]|uniref:hypothetical protein n=1 Tax=Eubacterium sp. TaxID=142586 RepID=UPI003F0C36EF
MKKSFKKVVAILLAVMMMVCSFPLTALAADGTRANIKLQFGSVTNSASNIKNYTVDRTNSAAKFITYSGMNSSELTYSNGAISGYETDDFFTVSVLVENISQISATEIAVKYSDAIEPAYIKNASSGTAPALYSESGSAVAGILPLEAITAQSGNAIYNTTSTVGETSYIDADSRVMHANFAVQTGADAIDLTGETTVGKYALTNSAIIATFMFKIVNSNAITFSIDTASDTYYLDTIANGGSVDEYKTYAPKVADDASTAELDFMGKNEYVGSSTTTYTITFVDADGQQISSSDYEEGAAVIAPQLPAVTHDDTNHYTYAWDVEPEATATKSATYTIVKTGAAHTWDAGVTTQEPTDTEDGVKTYTCTFDGCGATKTESIPATGETHTHTWSDWTYNGDAVYVSSSNYTDGTATRTCTDCGETETKTIEGTGLLRANNATVTLGAAVVLNTGIDKSRTSKFDSFYIEIVFDGAPYKLTEPSSKTTDTRYFFDFDKISPDKFGDEITITPYAVTSDGILCKGHEVKYSIKTYCYNTLGKSTSSTALKTLLVEMLYYGEAYQTYRNYNLDTLVTADLTDEQKALHTTDVPTYEKVTNPNYETNPNGTEANEVTFKAATLLLEGKVIPKIKFEMPKTSNIEDYTFCWIVNGVTTEFKYTDHPEWFSETTASSSTASVNNAYFVECQILKANQFSIPLDLIVMKNGSQISNKLRYSVESYAFSSAYSASTTLKNLVDQLLRYGRADVTYMGGTY